MFKFRFPCSGLRNDSLLLSPLEDHVTLEDRVGVRRVSYLCPQVPGFEGHL